MMKRIWAVSVVLVLAVSILFTGCDFIKELLGMESEPKATQLGVTISENSVNNGGNFTVVVTALDSSGTVVTSFSSAVTLSVSDGTIAPASVTLSSGSVSATPSISGINTETEVTVTASFAGLTSGSDTIIVSPPTATALSVDILETSITSGDSCEIDVAAIDASDVPVTTFTGTVQLSPSVGTLTPDTLQISSGGTANGAFVLSGVTSSQSVTVTASFTGLTSGSDSLSVTGAPIVATQVILEVTDDPKEVNNGDAVSLQVSAVDDYGNAATDFTGTINLAASGTAELSSNIINITTGGTATASPTIDISGLTADEIVTLTASYGGLTSGTDTVTVIFVPQGDPLLDTDLSSGWSELTGTYHLAARDPSSAEITVGGDIVISGGVKLVIYPGVTLDMGSNTMYVYGDLEIIGSDDARVRLKSSSNNWGGIAIGGDSAGSATAIIDGAFIDGLADSAIYCGTGSAEVSGQVSVTNSRIHITAQYTDAIRLRYMKSGTTNTFTNNIILFTNYNWRAFEGFSSLNGSITFNIEYNTIIGKGSANSALYTADSNATNIYNINRNLIAGGFTYAISLSGDAPQHNLTNNFIKVATNWDGGGGTYDSFVENLYESANEDNFTGTWDAGAVFTNYTSGDFTLAQTATFPSLTQASNINSMEGCLTAGNANEVGAYGNGGYPPNWDE